MVDACLRVDVLAGAGDVQPVQAAARAAAGELDVDVGPYQRAAELHRVAREGSVVDERRVGAGRQCRAIGRALQQ